MATTVFEDVDNSSTKVTLNWQPWNSDEIGNATFLAARAGMEAGVGGTFDKLEAYLKTIWFSRFVLIWAAQKASQNPR